METITSEIKKVRNGSPMAQKDEGMHILIADDDVHIRDAITEYLHREGYVVSAVEDGEAAYAILCDVSIDLLITDEDMPRLHGLELLRRLRRDHPLLPTILISGCMPWDEPDLENLITPGAALEKPFTLSRLLKEIRALSPKAQPAAK